MYKAINSVYLKMRMSVNWHYSAYNCFRCCFPECVQNPEMAYDNELVLDYVTCAELFLKSRMFYRFDALVIRTEKILHMLN